jgi:hypothetical protein
VFYNKSSKTTLRQFCAFVVERGGSYNIRLAAYSENDLYDYTEFSPKPGSLGQPYMIEIVDMDQILDQRLILSAKRVLKLY